LFAAWSPAQNLNDLPGGPETPLCESETDSYARHDLVWKGIDFHDPSLQAEVGHLCALVMQTGALDGCFLDWWNGDTTAGGSVDDRTVIAQKVRTALGDGGLLVVNVNGKFPPPSTARYINGLYMEGYGSSFFPLSSWQQAAQIMLFAVDGTGNLRSPSFSAFEGWYPMPASGYSTAGRND
jgi:hypothetical protein